MKSQLNQHKNSPFSIFSSFFWLRSLCQSSFSLFCIWIIADFFNLSVWAVKTLNFSIFLVSIWWDFGFNGNRCLNFGWFADLIAKVLQSCSLLSSKVVKFSMFKAFLYDLNLWPKMIFRAVFFGPSIDHFCFLLSESCAKLWQNVLKCFWHDVDGFHIFNSRDPFLH